MLEWITKPLEDCYNSTFGVMTPSQRLWTIIALLALYQLVAIKWRIIDRNRLDGVPSSFMGGTRRRFGLWINWRRNQRIMRAGFGSRMQPGTAVRTDLGSAGFGNNSPAGFTARNFGRTDLMNMSDLELANGLSQERLDNINLLRGHMSLGD